MKKEIIYLIILVIFISLFGLLVLKKQVKKENTNPYQEFSFYKENNLERYKKYYLNNNYSYKDVVLRVNMNLDNSFYTNTKEINNFDLLMLVNKYNYVNNNFKPTDLVKVSKFAVNNMYLNKTCMEAFISLASDALKEGYNIRAISTYRTYDYQNNLYNKYAKKDGVDKADTYSARPGFSEHHTGLAIDVDNIKTNFNNFENTNEFKWMQENAYKYGFILRYPSDKVDITGYMYEPWHYRYVGVEVAKIIKEKNLTFEEYYYDYLDKG